MTALGAISSATDVPTSSEAVLKTLYDANTVLAADSDNTPAALTMGASTILARLAAGNIVAATPSQLKTLLAIASGDVSGLGSLATLSAVSTSQITDATIATADLASATISAMSGFTTGWTLVTKSIDESVTSSTVLQADDALVFTATSGGKYEVEIVVLCTNAAGFTEDIKFAFGEDGTTRGHFMGVVPNASDTTAVPSTGANQAGTIPCGLGTDIKIFKFVGTHYGNGGTFSLMWAQNTSGGNASTVKASSILRYRRIL